MAGEIPSCNRTKQLGRDMADMREDLMLAGASRGTMVLEQLRFHSAVAAPTSGKASSHMSYVIPKTTCKCCLNCWGLAGDSASFDRQHNSILRGGMLTAAVAALNRKEINAKNMYPVANECKEKASFIPMDGAIFAWLDQWLPGNVDSSPMLPGKMHLDAPSRKFVYDIMKEEWELMDRHVPHYCQFAKVLRAHFNIVIHKHKKFAECQVCALYKELWAKSRMASTFIRTEIQAMRRSHLEQQYGDRLAYYAGREQSYSDPENHLCTIVDAMTEGNSSTPMTRRDAKGFKPAAYKTQLYGALVHGPEGFFGYTTSGLKGARVTVEVVHRTLLKLAKTRKVWPKFFRLQLDNTTSDCKNHTVMAYLAWLTATGVFEKAVAGFLMVGHTHEDIDGFFGILRRHLMRVPQGIMTTEALHKEVQKCFSKVNNGWVEEDADKEGMRDRHFDLEGMNKRVVVEHLASTYDWDGFLLQRKNPAGSAFCKLENIAQLGDPDVYRPHYWEFSIKQGVVVLNLKHWSTDTAFWNDSPMPVWNRIPVLTDLRPAKMEWSKGLKDMHTRLRWCQGFYIQNGLRCKEMAAGVDECPRCAQSKSLCGCARCIRCEQMSILNKYMQFKAANSCTEADLAWWQSHFDSLTQEAIDATLVPLDQMALPKCARAMTELPSFQEQMDNLPAMMKQAPEGLKCKVAVLGLGPKAFKEVVEKVAPRYRDLSKETAHLEINMLVGGLRTSKGKIEFAVLLRNGQGTWLSAGQLLRHEQKLQDAVESEDLRPKWFGADVQFAEVIVQEDSKRLYTARLGDYNHESEEWTLNFPRQRINTVFGTSACEAEVHSMDLEELSFVTGAVATPPSSEHGLPRDIIRMAAFRNGKLDEIVLPPCHVTVTCPDSVILRGGSSVQHKHHRFWVSRLHFGMEFIQSKLQPHMQHMKNQAVNLPKLQRCMHVGWPC